MARSQAPVYPRCRQCELTRFPLAYCGYCRLCFQSLRPEIQTVLQAYARHPHVTDGELAQLLNEPSALNVAFWKVKAKELM